VGDDPSLVFARFAASCEDMAIALALLNSQLQGRTVRATATRQTPAQIGHQQELTAKAAGRGDGVSSGR
jgi:hypothetical protein